MQSNNDVKSENLEKDFAEILENAPIWVERNAECTQSLVERKDDESL